MAFFYIRDSVDGTGSATGDGGRYASQQTGDWDTTFPSTASYYENEAAVIAATTPPVSGDTIYVSSIHFFNSGSVAISNNYSDELPPAITVICVDDANIENYRTTESGRAREATTSGIAADITLQGSVIRYGMEYDSVDNIVLRNNGGSNIYNDCKFIINTNSFLHLASGQMVVEINDSEIALNNTGSNLFMSGAGQVSINRGCITTDTVGITNLFSIGFTSGGGIAKLTGVDCSVIVGRLMNSAGGAITSDDKIDVILDMCMLSATVVRANESFKSQEQRILTTRCSSDSSESEYQYGLTALGGDIDDDSILFRSEDPAFVSSGAKISYKVVTNSDASINTPLWFDVPNSRFAELSVGSSDTLRFFIASTVALTNADIWVTVSYPDGTNKQTANHAGSAPSALWTTTINPLATPTTLTTDSSSDWRDGGNPLAGHNKYQIDVDTSGDVGADCVPIVRIFIAKPSATIQIASIYELV